MLNGFWKQKLTNEESYTKLLIANGFMLNKSIHTFANIAQISENIFLQGNVLGNK